MSSEGVSSEGVSSEGTVKVYPVKVYPVNTSFPPSPVRSTGVSLSANTLLPPWLRGGVRPHRAVNAPCASPPLTQRPRHCQEGDLVDDGAPADRPVVAQPGPLPHHPVHARLLYDTGDENAHTRSNRRPAPLTWVFVSVHSECVQGVNSVCQRQQ